VETAPAGVYEPRNPRAPSPSHPSTAAGQQFSPLDALAALTAFIPEKGQQIVRYYGFCSNKARGQRRRQGVVAPIPSKPSSPDAPQNDDFRSFCRRACGRLIRKGYRTDPLTCPKCGARLRIIRFIDNLSVIEKILRYLKLWDLPERSPPLRRPTTVEPNPDFFEWVAAARQFDGID